MDFVIFNKFRRLINNEFIRQEWVRDRLKKIPDNSKILDAGCGSQQYRKYCKHLRYYAQDFGKYSIDEKDSLTAQKEEYTYGKLDYIGNIWQIDEKDSTFDAILCTEVFEHIPYPNETIKEFFRLLKPGGILLLTVPSNCLRHMDPYYYFSGFSDRYLALILKEYNFTEINIEPVGNYHSWLMVETVRCMRHENFWALLMLWPAFIYHYLKQRVPSSREIDTLCFGYHVSATKSLT